MRGINSLVAMDTNDGTESYQYNIIHHQQGLKHQLQVAIHRYPIRRVNITKMEGVSCTFTAVTVRPALVVPTPVVKTDREISLAANFKN